MANKKRKKTGIGSYPADEELESGLSGGGETGAQSGVSTGAALGSSKMRKDGKGVLTSGPEKIQRDLDRYRDEMAEDAPASGSPEDNP
jgi:hypothetical protein